MKMRLKDPKLEAKIKDLERKISNEAKLKQTQIKNIQNKIKILITILIILFLGLTSSIGIVGYYYVKTYQEKLTYQEQERKKLSNNNSNLKKQLTDIEKKINSLENIEEIKNLSCPQKNKKSSKQEEKISLPEQKLNVLETKIKCLIKNKEQMINQKGQERDSIESIPALW